MIAAGGSSVDMGSAANVIERKGSGLHGWWRNFDSKFMKPIFGGSDPEEHRRRYAPSSPSSNAGDINIGSNGQYEAGIEAGAIQMGRELSESIGSKSEEQSLVDGAEDHNSPPSEADGIF